MHQNNWYGKLGLMGVKALGQLIKTVPNVVVPFDITHYHGQRFVVEVSAFMHRFFNASVSVDNNEHLQGFVEMWKHLTSAGIVVCFVFDGKQTMAKHEENQKRAATRAKRVHLAQENIEKVKLELVRLDEEISNHAFELAASTAKSVDDGASDSLGGGVADSLGGVADSLSGVADSLSGTRDSTDGTSLSAPPLSPLDTSPDTASSNQFTDMVKLATLRGQLFEEEKKATRAVTPQFYRDLKIMFRDLKIPYVVARYEAEQACSWLVRQGFADLVVSDDYDCLACNAPAFLQHYNHSGRQARIVHLAPLLTHLRMTYEEFVDFCILCGTDFGGHLRNIGPTRAGAIIRRYKRIEAFLASNEGRKHRAEAKDFSYDVPRLMFMDTSFPLGEYCLAGTFAQLNDRCDKEHLSSPVDRFTPLQGLGKREMEDGFRDAEAQLEATVNKYRRT